MKMAYEHDPMLAEIRQIRKALWEESGHDFHAMIQLITKEAQEIMQQYGKIPTKLGESEELISDSETYKTTIHI